MQALQGLAAAAEGYQVASAAMAAAGGNGSGELLKAEVGVGFSTAKSQNSSNYNNAVGSSIDGGGNVSLTSTQGDIHATGATIAAGSASGNTLTLNSANAIILDASQSNSSANGSTNNNNNTALSGNTVTLKSKTDTTLGKYVTIGKKLVTSKSNCYYNFL